MSPREAWIMGFWAAFALKCGDYKTYIELRDALAPFLRKD